jgi:hypothetical protein
MKNFMSTLRAIVILSIVGVSWASNTSAESVVRPAVLAGTINKPAPRPAPRPCPKPWTACPAN